jgi:type IV pilus assembly protein PilX
MSIKANNEKGSALIIAILFLMVLSILVAVLFHSSIFEMFSSKSYQDSQMAFYSAEEGAKVAMNWLNGLTVAPENSTTGIPSYFSDGAVTDPNWSSYVDSSTAGFRYRYYVEHLKDQVSPYSGGESAKIGNSTTSGNIVHYYRITSEGTSASGGAIKQIQIVVTAKY